jgi:hypothetical protein
VETRFSFRTRILDYLWAGLPVIATSGDSMSDLVEAEDLGAVVPPGDVATVTKALIDLGSDVTRREACAARSRAAGERFRWSAVAQPLIDYCEAPYQAPDRAVVRGETFDSRPAGKRAGPSEGRRIVRRAVEVLGSEGPKQLAAKGSAYLQRRRKP